MDRAKTIEEILQKPYHWVLVPEEDGSVFAYIKEFSGCATFDVDFSSALTRLRSTAESWLDAALDQGLEIPDPAAGFQPLY